MNKEAKNKDHQNGQADNEKPPAKQLGKHQGRTRKPPGNTSEATRKTAQGQTVWPATWKKKQTAKQRQETRTNKTEAPCDMHTRRGRKTKKKRKKWYICL